MDAGYCPCISWPILQLSSWFMTVAACTSFVGVISRFAGLLAVYAYVFFGCCVFGILGM